MEQLLQKNGFSQPHIALENKTPCKCWHISLCKSWHVSPCKCWHIFMGKSWRVCSCVVCPFVNYEWPKGQRCPCPAAGWLALSQLALVGNDRHTERYRECLSILYELVPYRSRHPKSEPLSQFVLTALFQSGMFINVSRVPSDLEVMVGLVDLENTGDAVQKLEVLEIVNHPNFFR